MDYAARNLMTLGTLMIVATTILGAARGDLPADAAFEFAQWAFAAGCGGRAFVMGLDAYRSELVDDDADDVVHAEGEGEG